MAQPKSNNLPILIGAAAIVVALAIVAALATAGGDDNNKAEDRDAAVYQQVSVAGSPLPPHSSGESQAPNEAVGAQAPDLAGKDFYGDPVEIKADGKPKVVVFYAHWCPHCQKELPLISDWLRDNRSKYSGVDFYGVATSTNPTRPNFPPASWFKKEGYTGPVLVDDQRSSAATAYGLGSYPYLVFLDGQNRVVTRTSGEPTMTQFEELVKQTAAAAAPSTSAPQAAAPGQTTPAPGDAATTTMPQTSPPPTSVPATTTP